MTTTTDHARLFDQITAPENRADPYGLWAQLREEPVSRQHDGRWVITGYPEARAIIDDPRITATQPQPPPVPFVVLDPPEHDIIRAQIMKHFGPPHRPDFVTTLSDRITDAANDSLDRIADQPKMDLVADFAYRVPVAVICTVLGVPPEDETAFSAWTRDISKFADPAVMTPADMAAAQRAWGEASQYMGRLIFDKRRHPGPDLLSGLATAGDLPDDQIIMNAIVLLNGGHETTVNAIANGVLLMLRQPDLLATLRDRPELMAAAFEEILRLEPPLQFRDRRSLADIEIDGRTIPAGADIIIGYAAANRDPRRFPNPDQLVVGREDNQHLAFNTGVHYCFGAPMARLEGRIALNLWLRRVSEPRLLDDPPPYQPSAAIRGPAELLIGHQTIDSR